MDATVQAKVGFSFSLAPKFFVVEAFKGGVLFQGGTSAEGGHFKMRAEGAFVFPFFPIG